MTAKKLKKQSQNIFKWRTQYEKKNEKKKRPKSIQTHSKQNEKNQHRTKSHERRNKIMSQLYSFKDVKIGFMDPMIQQSELVAMRTFKITVENEKNIASKYKEDLELWKIGEWNETTGEIKPDLKYIMGGKDI